MRTGRDFNIGEKVTHKSYNEKLVIVLITGIIIGWREVKEGFIKRGIYKVEKKFDYLVLSPDEITAHAASRWELDRAPDQYSIEELLTHQNERYRTMGIWLQKRAKAKEKKKLKSAFPYR